MINMIPPYPAPPESKPVKAVVKPKLLTKNTHVEIVLDPEDYEIAKHVMWYEIRNITGFDRNNDPIMESEGRIMNKSGVEIKEYLKITGTKFRITAFYDFRRRNYTTGE